MLIDADEHQHGANMLIDADEHQHLDIVGDHYT